MNLKRLAIHAADSYQWSRSRQQTSGRWRGDATHGCAAYYKAPWSFLAAGDPAAAASSLSYVQSRFLQPDGDLGPIHNESLVRQNPLYVHGHVAVGAARMGRLDVTGRLLEFLAAHRHERLAGWGDRCDANGERRYGSVSTACIGLAFLERGDLDLASGAVEFLARLIALQPKPETVFFQWIADDGSLLTAPRDGDLERDCSVRLTQRFQVWWAISFPLILLARFAGLTNDASAWRTATRYLALLDRSPQAWNDLSAGKLSLACALMYRHRGDPRHRARAMQAARAVASRMTADGGWHACQGGEGGTPAAPTRLGYEVNLEFALTMAWAGRCLAERDGTAFTYPAVLERPGPLARWICRSERILLGFAREKSYGWHAARRR